jgi:hypothetical protein
MKKQINYTPGKFESVKFFHQKKTYYEGLKTICDLNYSKEDLIHHFPAFAGTQTIIRFLSLYELFKMTEGIAGHIAEMGVYKGSGSLWFAKLLQIFEPNSLSQVHGFDWFKGTEPTSEEPNLQPGSYSEPFERVNSLVASQGLSHVIKLHDLDLRKDLPGFFSSAPHLRFRLVFADAGLYDIVREIIINVWPRISKGGILVLDQYNFDLAPGETRAVNELLPDVEVRTLPWGWMPTAFIVK